MSIAMSSFGPWALPENAGYTVWDLRYTPLPSGNDIQKAIDNGPVEIVDLPLTKMVIFHGRLFFYPRVNLQHPIEIPNEPGLLGSLVFQHVARDHASEVLEIPREMLSVRSQLIIMYSLRNIP